MSIPQKSGPFGGDRGEGYVAEELVEGKEIIAFFWPSFFIIKLAQKFYTHMRK